MTLYTPISKYVTNLEGNVFALKNIPEEVAAVLFAYYSRSPYGLRDNLLQLLNDGDLDMSDNVMSENDGINSDSFESAKAKAKAFHEKWVVGYGHGSVAEHSVIKLALENISIVASKLVEDSRLSSYTEKSTRYVQFSEDSVFIPKTFGLEQKEDERLLDIYEKTVKYLMRANLELVPRFTKRIMSETEKGPKQTDKGFETSCRATAFDTLRYILPTALLTNVGVTINARSLAGMIIKLRSSENPEAIALADQIKTEADKISPTLLKYVDPSPYRTACAQADGREGELTAIMCPQNSVNISGHYLNEDQALGMIGMGTRYMGGKEYLEHIMPLRGPHDAAPRQFERVSLSFMILVDYGAWRDIQRHRMTTQITGPLSPFAGYETPPRIIEYGQQEFYDKLMQQSTYAYNELSNAGGDAAKYAQYVLPLGMRIGVEFTANLREIIQFIELRSARQGHPSYRKIAQQMFKEVEKVYPTVAQYIRVNIQDYDLTRAEK